MFRSTTAALALALLTMASTATPAAAQTGLEAAIRNYPPLIIGSNTDPVRGPVSLRACPASGGGVEQKGGPTTTYLGAAPASPNAANPTLCRMNVGGDIVDGWYGIWLTSWPGAAQAYPALTRLIADGTGAIEAFDVVMAPGFAYHDVIRNEGVENIHMLDHVYRALKLSHYREGYETNTYRSVSTVWKDLDSGMIIYATYQHIAGAPELDAPLIPTKITPAP